MNARAAKFDELTAFRAIGRAPKGADADAIDARTLARAFWRWRWLTAAVTLFAGVLVYVLVGQGTPTFTAYSKLMLDVRKTQIITADEVVSEVDPSEQIVNSELAVLRANLVIDEVIARLAPAQLDQLDPALKPKSLKERIVGPIKAVLKPGSGAASSIDEAALRRARLVDAIRNSRQIYAERDSYVMVIKVEADDPVLARDVANATATSYVDLQLGNRHRAVENATAWLEERLVELSADVEEAEAAVANFQTQALPVDGGTLENFTQQLLSLNSQLIAASDARVEAEARRDQLISVMASGGPAAAARVVDTPGIQTLRATELELQQADAVWARSFSADQARRVSIREELDELIAVMGVEVQNEIQLRRSEAEVARSREAGLRERIAELDTTILRIKRGQLELKQLQRQADAARNTYEALLIRVSEARAQRQMQQPDALLIERAEAPRAPTAPRPALLAAMSMFVTFAMMSSWIFFREVSPTTFRGIRELAAETDLPVVTSIPRENWRSTRDMLMSIRQDPFSRYAERIRQLRTALTVGHPGHRNQSVMIMSSAPGEGKSTTSLALAQMAALSGRSTIVVDCDLRRPEVAKALQINQYLTHDFSDFIENRCQLSDAIHHSEEFGFDVLAAREPHRSAADALKVAWLRPMLKALGEAYDLVVIDAPALLAVPDALTLVREVDTRLYLVAFDETPRTAVQTGLNKLSELGLGVSGMILNRVDTRRTHDTLAEGYGYEF